MNYYKQKETGKEPPLGQKDVNTVLDKLESARQSVNCARNILWIYKGYDYDRYKEASNITDLIKKLEEEISWLQEI